LSRIQKINLLTSKGFLMLIALLILIVILTFFFGDSGIVEIISTQNRISDLEAQIQELENEKKRLENEIRELIDNPLALEKRAREKLWLMKKNEKVVVIVKDKKAKKGSPEQKKRPK
jgi:cell division protein FtsB